MLLFIQKKKNFYKKYLNASIYNSGPVLAPQQVSLGVQAHHLHRSKFIVETERAAWIIACPILAILRDLF